MRFLRGFAPCADGPVCAGRRQAATVHTAVSLAGRALVVRVEQDGPEAVRYDVHAAGPIRERDDDAVRDFVRHWLSLDDPVAEFYALAAGDPVLAGPVADQHGLHQVRFRTLAEGATWFTITHRVGQRAALAWKRALAERCGRPIRYRGEVLYAFPDLADLWELPDAALLAVLRAPNRVARLRSVLSGVAGLGEEWLRTAPFGQARDALLAVRGVGPFTADAVLFRVLGRLGPIATGADPAAATRYGDWIGYRGYYQRSHAIPAAGRIRQPGPAIGGGPGG